MTFILNVLRYTLAYLLALVISPLGMASDASRWCVNQIASDVLEDDPSDDDNPEHAQREDSDSRSAEEGEGDPGSVPVSAGNA